MRVSAARASSAEGVQRARAWPGGSDGRYGSVVGQSESFTQLRTMTKARQSEDWSQMRAKAAAHALQRPDVA